MIYRIKVWDKSGAVIRLAGEMICVDDRGKMQSAFRYDGEFLGAADRFSLDPVSLPLKPGTIDAPMGFFGAFEDSLPDDWGRRLLVRKHNFPRHSQNLPALLLALGNSGLGALAFTARDLPDPPSEEPSIIHLGELAEAAEKFEKGEALDIELTRLFAAGSSPGGARPKALVYDPDAPAHYLAKFPSTKDDVDVVRIEAATMILAEKAGLRPAPTRLVDCGGKPILLVERFDILPNGRRHMVSLQTLLLAQGFYQLRYFDMLNVIRKFSSDPLNDSEQLYRQMVFNGLMGNTDDHLKNFLMVYEQGIGWRLSPAFDLIPDIGRREEHVLFFDTGAYCPSLEKLAALGRTWGISRPEAVVAQVCDAVARWQDVFVQTGVPVPHLQRFKGIDSRLGRT